MRLAAFQNPEFYRAQAMRMPVWDKPRVIGCAENFPEHIGLPRGCLEAVQQLLRAHGICCDLRDERSAGEPLAVEFVGTLRPDQEAAAKALLKHDTGALCAPGEAVSSHSSLVENCGQIIVVSPDAGIQEVFRRLAIDDARTARIAEEIVDAGHPALMRMWRSARSAIAPWGTALKPPRPTCSSPKIDLRTARRRPASAYAFAARNAASTARTREGCSVPSRGFWPWGAAGGTENQSVVKGRSTACLRSNFVS